MLAVTRTGLLDILLRRSLTREIPYECGGLAIWQALGYRRREGRADRPAKGHSDLRPRRAEFGCLRPGSRTHAADAAGYGRNCLHLADHDRHRDSAWHCLLLLPSNH